MDLMETRRRLLISALGGNFVDKLKLLKRVVVEDGYNTNVLRADIPQEAFDFDILIIFNHGTTSINDWLYYPYNTMGVQDPYMTTESSRFYDVINIIYKIDGKYFYKRSGFIGNEITVEDQNFITMHTWTTTVNLAYGSYIEIYGANIN